MIPRNGTVETFMNRKFRIALAAVVILALLWLVFSRLFQEPNSPAPPPPTVQTSGQTPAPAPPVDTLPPAYILEGNVVKVNVPFIGWVEGIKHPPMELKTRSTSITPEILVTDAEGHFLYLRNHPPLYHSKRDLQAWVNAWEDEWKERNREDGTSHPLPRILGPGKRKLLDPYFLEDIADRANCSDHDFSDIEVWGVRFVAPLHGEMDGYLVADTRGRASGGAISVPSQQGLTRGLEFWAYHGQGKGIFGRTSGSLEVFEEWIGKPPISDAEHRKGQRALEGNARRMFIEDEEKAKAAEEAKQNPSEQK